MMSTIDTIRSSGSSIVVGARMATRQSLRALLRGLIQALVLWSQKRRSRAILRTLTDDELRDIGVTRREAEREAGKSFFWD